MFTNLKIYLYSYLLLDYITDQMIPTDTISGAHVYSVTDNLPFDQIVPTKQTLTLRLQSDFKIPY